MKITKIEPIIVVKILLFFILLTCLSSCEPKNKTSEDSFLLKVQVKDAVQKTVPIFIDSFGSLAASKDVDIRPQVPGQILKLHFKEGQFVKKGDLLVSIDPETYQANLDNSIASLEYVKADLKLKEYIVKKNRNIAISGALPKQDFEKMLTDLEKAKAQIKVDEAQIKLDKINLKYCSVRSPINGIVGINKIDVGNIVNSTNVLCNVKSIDPLYVDFSVPEKNIGRLKDSMMNSSIKTIIYVKRLRNDERINVDHYAGKLEFLNNTADAATGTIPLRAIVTNKTGSYLPGEFADVRMEVGKRNNAVLIPQSAVKYGAGGAYVYIAEKGHAKRIDIVTGDSFGDYYILLKGAVNAPDKVIVTGLESITAGTKIKITEIEDGSR